MSACQKYFLTYFSPATYVKTLIRYLCPMCTTVCRNIHSGFTATNHLFIIQVFHATPVTMWWINRRSLFKRVKLNEETISASYSIMRKITPYDKCLIGIRRVDGNGIGTRGFSALIE